MNHVAEAPKGLIRRANEALILSAAEKVFARAGFGGATMAAIAEASGLPKANLHYYFGSKEVLYRAVLAQILSDWLVPTHGITVDADPRTALEQYIRAKMELSAQRPDGSKVWANELLHGAPVVKELLATDLRQLTLEKPLSCKRGWTPNASPPWTACTSSSPSGLPRKLMPTLTCRSAL